MVALLEADTYMIRQKVLKILGEEFHIYSDESMENMIGYSKQKALKLKEDIRVYSDESQSTELLTIKQKGILDFSGGFGLVDGQTGDSLGSMKRKCLKSMFKDSWVVLNSEGNEVGTLGEDSGVLALVRRFVPGMALFIPQVFSLKMNGASGEVTFTQKINPLVHKLVVSGVSSSGIDPRIAASAAVLLIAIEGRQG
jgi:hypothetical protein